jgi:hypothetical protein
MLVYQEIISFAIPNISLSITEAKLLLHICRPLQLQFSILLNIWTGLKGAGNVDKFEYLASIIQWYIALVYLSNLNSERGGNKYA